MLRSCFRSAVGEVSRLKPITPPGDRFPHVLSDKSDMDETLSSIYAKADSLRRQIDDSSAQGDSQVVPTDPVLANPRQTSKNVSRYSNGANSSSNA
jgi:hypothetical protein